ncbi:hypothetical protein RclHR1_00040037 [Rhizophagus clarus]|uniref:Uncharacterized protein n=1 Tax=Rhizophagus clarus TaxID=94130 RepID=A0A2Z6RE66_9GLOM|nr:hypothetical protein RclHR1_00040037 [Rhizophagus clarus]GES91739.1 hypothetical protein GLOIN_2v1848952 [Rhizophagus clarus]
MGGILHVSDGKGCKKTKDWAPIVLLRYLLERNILESITIGEAIISLDQQRKVWLPDNRDISCAIIGKFTQGIKADEKRLMRQLVIDKEELNFLIRDCKENGTLVGRDKCPLGYILTYYDELLRRFNPKEMARIATDSLYVKQKALYKLDNGAYCMVIGGGTKAKGCWGGIEGNKKQERSHRVIFARKSDTVVKS